MLDLYEEEIPLLITQIEKVKKRERIETRAALMETSGIGWAKKTDRDSYQRTLERELREALL